MSIDDYRLLGFLVILINGAISFWIGKMQEREKWNQLIRDGIIPPPGTWKR